MAAGSRAEQAIDHSLGDHDFAAILRKGTGGSFNAFNDKKRLSLGLEYLSLKGGKAAQCLESLTVVMNIAVTVLELPEPTPPLPANLMRPISVKSMTNGMASGDQRQNIANAIAWMRLNPRAKGRKMVITRMLTAMNALVS